MGIQDWLATQWGYTKPEAKAQAGASLRVVLEGESPLVPSDWADLSDSEWAQLAITCGWVYSNVTELSRLSSPSKLEVHRRDGETTEPVYDHEFEQVLRHPNKNMGRNFIREYTWGWWLLRGEAYWLLRENDAGELAEIWPLPASRMVPIPHPTEYISGYKYYPLHGREPKTLSVEQVFFLRFPNFFDYHRGLSPISAYKLALQTGVEAEKWNLGTFTKEVALRTLFTIHDQGGRFEAAADRIEEDLNTKGLRYMVVPAEHIDVKEFGLKHKDIEFLAMQEFDRGRIDRVYGFPEGYWSEHANRATAEQSVATVINGTVWPLLQLIAEELTSQVVIPRYGSEYLVLPFDIRPEDRRLQIAERKVNWPVVKLNEARDELGKGEYDGPLAEFISELPVSLATDPQFVMAIAGLKTASPGGFGGDGLEAGKDLRRWKSIALRRFRDGEDPLGYDFESSFLPAEAMAEVRAALEGVDTEDRIKAAFDIELPQAPQVLGPDGWIGLERIKAAVLTGMPVEDLWPLLGLGFDKEKLKEMRAKAYGEGEPEWRPEEEEGGGNDEARDE